MAKGDDARARNRIDYEKNLAQENLNNLRSDTLIPQNQTFWNNYLLAKEQADKDYGKLSAGYDEFAKTGGFSPQDIENIRARAIAPTRSIYSGANREVDRSRSISGYSPGFGVLKGRMAREMSQGISDANINAEGMISQLRNQGRLAGLSGGSNLYSATPGAANLYGSQALSSTAQRLQGEGLQQNLGLGTMQAQIEASKLPGKWESTVGRINDVFDIGKKAGDVIYPWL